MRNALFFLFLLLTLVSSAQLIDFRAPLFTTDGFFHRDEIQENKVRFIVITRSDKKDGKVFQNETPLLKYNFSKKGVLVGAEKYIRLSHKIDTAKVKYFYDRKLKLYKKIREQGPFRFDFHFQYKDDLIYKEMKIDGKSEYGDTAYIRFFKHDIAEKKMTTTVLNAAHKPFQIKEREIDSDNRIIKEKTSFMRNSNNYAVLYNYEGNLLSQRKEISYLGELNESTWTFSYASNKVDYIQLKSAEQKLKKYALLYDGNLPSAIVERNIQKKEVIVYKFQYIFYD